MSRRKRNKRRKASDDSRPDNQSFQRDDPPPFYRRNTDLQPDSLDSTGRRVQSVLTTEDPALVYDYRRGNVILEVLLADGCDHESQTPLIRDHNQYTVTSIVGSVTEHAVRNDGIDGWLCFGTKLDDVAEGIWRRVEQGHLRRVSVGYDYTTADYETIPAGETRTVKGRVFTAEKDRDLRVVFNWRLREVSLVVVPADPRAQMRSGTGIEPRGTPDSGETQSISTPPATRGESPTTPSGEVTMKKYLRFLHKHGLASNVTNEVEALRWAADGNLTDAQIGELATLCTDDNVEFDATVARARVAPTGQRSAPNNGPQEITPSPQTVATAVDVQRAATDAVTAERTRVSGIRALHAEHPDVPEATRDEAENAGWTLEETRGHFLTALRDARPDGVAPAGHVRGSEQLNQRVLQAALLERFNIRPDSAVFNHETVRSLGRREELDSGWMVNVPQQGQRRDDFEQAFDVARQRGLDDLSLMRAAELVGEMEDGRRLHNEDDILERAFSSGGFGAVFGAVVHLQMLASYAATPATYKEFCQVMDVADLRKNDGADMGAVGRLKKQGKVPGQAATLNIDDPVLVSVCAERYAGLMKVTDQTIINDSFGIVGMLPSELGQTCQQMPIDLAYAQVLRSDNLADGRPRYNTTDGNVIDVTEFDEDALTALGVALKVKKVGDRRIVVEGSSIVAGVGKSPAVRKYMNSKEINNATNPHAGTYRSIEDSAVDLGVMDPAADDEELAGTPNSVYSFAGGSKRSVAVAFRRGTNRGPVTRRGTLSQGEWGVYWDVFMDVGAAFQRRTGTVKMNING